MGVSEVELLLTKHVSQRDESFEVWLCGDPRGGLGLGFIYNKFINNKFIKGQFDEVFEIIENKLRYKI